MKQLTGDDTVSIEQKFQNSRSIKYKGSICFSCNDLPSFGGDRGQHVYDRFLIISCNNVIPKDKQNKNLVEDMYAEREVTVSVAVKLLQDVIANGHKITESKKAIKNRMDYQIKNDSLTLFLKECCEVGKGRTRTSEFKTQYKKWCIDNKLEAEKSHDINRILTEEFGINKIKSDVEYYELEFKEEFQKYYF